MTEDYDLAKPNPWFNPQGAPEPFAVDPETGLPPFMVDVELPDPADLREDLTGFVPGRDRMLTAPEFLDRSRGHQPPDGFTLPRELPPGRYLVAPDGSVRPDPVTSETSDGYHTFRELYDHRRALTAALLCVASEYETWQLTNAWRSRLHHPEDSPCYEGYFIVGVEVAGKPITYHYANQYWDDFCNVPEVEHAPKYDGAGPATTVTRLIDYARS